jgi:hypothetical protein
MFSRNFRNSDYSAISSVLVYLGGVILGIYFIVVSCTSGGKYTGTLTSAVVTYQKNKSKKGSSGSYYVKEIFQKDSTAHTCSIQRLHSYSTKHAANEAKDHVKLGTQRKIWSYWNNDDLCYDEQIQYYNRVIGSVILGLLVVLPMIVLVVLLAPAAWKRFNKHYNPAPTDDKPTYDRTPREETNGDEIRQTDDVGVELSTRDPEHNTEV